MGQLECPWEKSPWSQSLNLCIVLPSSRHWALRGSVVLGVCADTETYNQPTQLQSTVTAKMKTGCYGESAKKGKYQKAASPSFPAYLEVSCQFPLLTVYWHPMARE